MSDDATISVLGPVEAEEGVEALRRSSQLALLVAWSVSEPHRAGEVALVPPGTVATLGRGDGIDGAPRVAFVRQRPGVNEATGPLGGLGLSRDQLRVTATGAAVAIERLGRKPVTLRGTEVDRCSLRPGDVLDVRGQLLLMCVRRPSQLPARRRFPLEACGVFGEPDALGMIGESESAWKLREDLAFAAQAEQHVLLHGESGTGKELAAQALHQLSRRRAQPLVARNAATLPPGLVDAELFGHARNYPNPGMPDRSGLIGEANGGVLFLDEIAELPLDLQSHLLRVLDARGEYQRLGDATARRSDFLLVGATNRDVASLKPDLLARFALRVDVPPLRTRPEDIPFFVRNVLARAARRSPALVERFVSTVDGVSQVRVATRLVAQLLSRSFDANVRELEALLWRAIAASRGEAVDALDEPQAPSFEARPGEVSAESIRAALIEQEGNMTRAAVALGMPSRFALYRLMKKLGLEVRDADD
jgi:two-component system nitrogen regulation response regulator GlnG/two-component system response regulator HydG